MHIGELVSRSPKTVIHFLKRAVGTVFANGGDGGASMKMPAGMAAFLRVASERQSCGVAGSVLLVWCRGGCGFWFWGGGGGFRRVVVGFGLAAGVAVGAGEMMVAHLITSSLGKLLSR